MITAETVAVIDALLNPENTPAERLVLVRPIVTRLDADSVYCGVAVDVNTRDSIKTWSARPMVYSGSAVITILAKTYEAVDEVAERIREHMLTFAGKLNPRYTSLGYRINSESQGYDSEDDVVTKIHTYDVQWVDRGAGGN